MFRNKNINTITTAVPFLLISPDSRSGAMGDVGVAIKKNITPNSYYQYILADKTEVNLTNVGYSVRIFDYDRSCKTKSTKPL